VSNGVNFIINVIIANFNPENPRIGMPKSRDLGNNFLAGAE